MTIDLLEDKRQKIVRKIKIVEDDEVVAKNVAKMNAGKDETDDGKAKETEESEKGKESEESKEDEIDEVGDKTEESESVETDNKKTEDFEVAICIESIDIEGSKNETSRTTEALIETTSTLAAVGEAVVDKDAIKVDEKSNK